MTPRQDRAQAEYERAYEAHRIARHGERAKTMKLLEKANLEVLAAETEANRIEKVERAA